MEENILRNTFPLQVDSGNIPYLSEAAKWGKFLSVLGFIIIAIILICGVIFAFEGNSLSSADLESDFQTLNLPQSSVGIIFGVYFLVIAIAYFFPCLYLYYFSTKMQAAIRNNDQITLNRSFQNLKSLFKFFGVLTIIALCIWVIAITFGVILGTVFSK